MNTPSDYPSPDQENVYYSIASLRTKLSEYFDKAIIDDIITRYDDYNLPVFVLDDTNTPESYIITVFSENKPTDTKKINQAGGIITSPKLIVPETSNVTSEIIDNGSTISLDPSYHSTNAIRDNGFKLKLSPDLDQIRNPEDKSYPLELILSTKYMHDTTLIQERSRFLAIIRNIVSDGIRNLSTQEYEKLKAEHDRIKRQSGRR